MAAAAGSVLEAALLEVQLSGRSANLTAAGVAASYGSLFDSPGAPSALDPADAESAQSDVAAVSAELSNFLTCLAGRAGNGAVYRLAGAAGDAGGAPGSGGGSGSGGSSGGGSSAGAGGTGSSSAGGAGISETTGMGARGVNRFDGYIVTQPMYETRRAQYSNITRVVGDRGGNHVLVGLLLHQTRRASSHMVSTGSNAYARTGTECESKFRSITASCDGRIQDVDYDALGGIGADPVFSPLSRLYKPALSVNSYYNGSARLRSFASSSLSGRVPIGANGSAAAVAAAGAAPAAAAAVVGAREAQLGLGGSPFGFFHTPLHGFPPGYPLVIDTRVGELRAQQVRPAGLDRV